jgi:hypothetical protein
MASGRLQRSPAFLLLSVTFSNSPNPSRRRSPG